jgi:hypothetical protein
MFMITPAEITRVRAQIGFESKVRSGSTGSAGPAPSSASAASSSSIPAIFT